MTSNEHLRGRGMIVDVAMGRMAGCRNIVVHGYAGVNLEVVRDIVEHRLGDLLAFVAAIRARLP